MPRRGNCYVAAEALFHCFAKAAGYQAYRMPWMGDMHWFLGKKTDAARGWFTFHVIDPSVRQWRKADRPTPVDYIQARCTGFLTKRPSKRARELMRRLTWQ